MVEYIKKKTFIKYFLYALGRKCLFSSLIKTIETTIFTLFPIIAMLFCNYIETQSFNFSGITFSLLVTYAYALLIPPILCIIEKKDCNNTYMLITIFIAMLIAVAMTKIAPDAELKINDNSIIISVVFYIVTLILLFISTFNELKQDFGLDDIDNVNQDKIRQNSKNIGDEDE